MKTLIILSLCLLLSFSVFSAEAEATPTQEACIQKLCKLPQKQFLSVVKKMISYIEVVADLEKPAKEELNRRDEFVLVLKSNEVQRRLDSIIEQDRRRDTCHLHVIEQDAGWYFEMDL